MDNNGTISIWNDVHCLYMTTLYDETEIMEQLWDKYIDKNN